MFVSLLEHSFATFADGRPPQNYAMCSAAAMSSLPPLTRQKITIING